MKRIRCQHCKTWMRYEQGATTVSCGECGARYTIEQRTRVRGALQRGITQALRKGLANDPSACKPCQGTGIRSPVAAERAATRAMLLDSRPPSTTPCPRCAGTGTAPAKRSVGKLNRRLGLYCNVGGRRVRVEVCWAGSKDGALAEQVVARTSTSLTGLQVRSLRRAVERRLEHEGWHIDGEIRHEGRQD